MFSRSLLYASPISGLSTFKNVLGTTTQVAGLKNFPPPIKYDIELPPDTRGKKLAVLPKVPQYPPTMRPFKMQLKLKLMRGPETVSNNLLHKQYGVIALIGGRLKYGHFEMIRWTCGKKLPDAAFSKWRVDPPWQPVTKKGVGQRMGGGKGAIDHYVTPVKAGRVILEVGGPIEYAEVKKVLEEIAHKLPFKAMAVSYKSLQNMREREKYLELNNENPYNMKYIIQNNLGGCHNWIKPIDKYFFGKYQ